MLGFASPRQGMAQISYAEGTVTPDMGIGAGAYGHDFEGSFGLQHFTLHAGRGLRQDFSPPLPKTICMSSNGVPAEQQDQGGMESETLCFWLTSTGARGCLITMAVPVTRASHAEGAGSSAAALPTSTVPPG